MARLCSKAQELLSSVRGQYLVSEHIFTSQALLAALYPVSEAEQKQYWEN